MSPEPLLQFRGGVNHNCFADFKLTEEKSEKTYMEEWRLTFSVSTCKIIEKSLGCSIVW